MSIDKKRLHELIDLISEDKLEEVVIVLQDYVEKKESVNLFNDLLNNPIKVENFSKFNREELYER